MAHEEADSSQSRGGASAHREGEGRRLEHQSARRAVVCIGLRCLGQRLARPTIRTCRRQLAHGRWASDRVSRSAREAGASLQMNETRQLQVAAARKAAVSAFWQEQTRCSPPTVQNEKQLARIAARRDFVLRELATRPPSGKRVSEARSEHASKRSRGARGRYGPTAVAASAPPSSPSPPPPSPSPPPPSLSPRLPQRLDGLS